MKRFQGAIFKMYERNSCRSAPRNGHRVSFEPLVQGRCISALASIWVMMYINFALDFYTYPFWGGLIPLIAKDLPVNNSAVFKFEFETFIGLPKGVPRDQKK